MLALIGDNIEPRTDLEHVFVLLLTVFGALMYAAIFGQVAVLIRSFERVSLGFQERLDTIGDSMRSLRLPEPVQQRVLEYWHFRWNLNQAANSYALLDGLSEPLV